VLYNEEIALESPDGKVKDFDRRVIFWPFTGVGPRQYARLFSMSERGSKRGKSLSVWNDERRLLRPLYVTSNDSVAYLAAEKQALADLPTEIYDRDKVVVPTPDDTAAKT
jgi:hypothetical protein